jgi:glycosyltransferase involved in cell wall biosynthesis
MKISVVICSHNPRPDYLRRVFEALRLQTFEVDEWELLLIDNACREPLATTWDISWHPHSRHVREDHIGLTYARLRGINEARGDLIVFVDDDNVLSSDYLVVAFDISNSFPQIGAFGCSLSGEFEVGVPWSIKPYLGGLCIRELERDHWSNEYSWSDAVPFGAGMCVRNVVAKRYKSDVESSILRKQLDRSGSEMGAGGDTDLAWTAIDLGYGTGRFKRLKAVHLIPAQRLNDDYIARLYAGFEYSNILLQKTRGLLPLRPRQNWRDMFRFLTAYATLRGLERRIYLATRDAANAAVRTIETQSGW